MNLKEIKYRRSKFVRTFMEASGENIMVADWMQVDYDWLITELEKKRDVDIQSVLAWEAGERSAALRCAEIAEEYISMDKSRFVGEAIRKEFKLET